MRWEGRRESGNIEDRRGGGGRAMRYGVGGIGGLVLVVVVLLLGGDPRQLLEQMPEQTQVGEPSGGEIGDAGQGAPVQESPEEAQTRRMIGVVLADTEETWQEIFRGMRARYEEPKLVLFREAVDSGCGFAQRGGGTLLLPARRQGLPRPRLLRRAARALRRRRATSRRPTCSPTRSAITCRTCWASPTRWPRRSSGADARRPTRSPCASSCRRTASPACGRITPTSRAQLLEPGDIEEGLARRERDRRRPHPDAVRRATSRLTPSRTAAPRTASRGSGAGSSGGAWTPATRSTEDGGGHPRRPVARRRRCRSGGLGYVTASPNLWPRATRSLSIVACCEKTKRDRNRKKTL